MPGDASKKAYQFKRGYYSEKKERERKGTKRGGYKRGGRNRERRRKERREWSTER